MADETCHASASLSPRPFKRRILITGDREWTNIERVYTRLSTFKPDEVIIVHGNCRGADIIAKCCAIELGMEQESHPANWRRYKKGAGPIRNQEMLDCHPENPIEHCIAFHEHIETSTGTADMLARVKKAGISWELNS